MKTYTPIIIVMMIITQPVKADFIPYSPFPHWIYPTNNIQVLQTTKKKHYDGVQYRKQRNLLRVIDDTTN